MAQRLYFTCTGDDSIYQERMTEFTYFSGFSLSQKQKCIASFHESIQKREPSVKILEASTKSQTELGKSLSAFNLPLCGHHLENIFQSAKKFEQGGPYPDLLAVSPKDAKRDERLHTSGKLTALLGGQGVSVYTDQLFLRLYLYSCALCTAAACTKNRAV